jgi:hypothetical protein
MTTSPAIRLVFDDAVPYTVRSRIAYAFRVFASIYGYRVVENTENRDARVLIYGSTKRNYSSNCLLIPALYSPGANGKASGYSKIKSGGEEFFLFHGLDLSTGRPDWLGEIFEWLSCSHEKSITARDAVGRIPYSGMIFPRANLSPVKPQAALHMAWLEHYLRNAKDDEPLPKAPSPVSDADHLVVCSHDVDFYFTNRRSTFFRIAKNLGISWLVYKSPSYFRSTLGMMGKWMTGERVGDYFSPLIARMENHNARSAFFIVPLHGHQRDPDYALENLVPQIKKALARGFSVEIHGSYNSIIENKTLRPEAKGLRKATGKEARGGRQHWLRFDDHAKLFQAIEDAELIFDSSLGFPETVGFRNGACFAFPPYDFKNERPHNFLEIPLAIMDGSLVDESRLSGEDPQVIAERVLGESRKRGWGGISVLWHNPVEPLSVPPETNQVFWNCLEAKGHYREKWLSTDQFLSAALPRYQNAGLLQGISLDGEVIASPEPERTNKLALSRAV